VKRQTLQLIRDWPRPTSSLVTRARLSRETSGAALARRLRATAR
jgi:hypothetical protein